MNNPASTSTLTLSSSSSSMQYSNVPMTMTHMPSPTKTMVNRMMTPISPLVPRLVRLFFERSKVLYWKNIICQNINFRIFG